MLTWNIIDHGAQAIVRNISCSGLIIFQRIFGYHIALSKCIIKKTMAGKKKSSIDPAVCIFWLSILPTLQIHFHDQGSQQFVLQSRIFLAKLLLSR